MVNIFKTYQGNEEIYYSIKYEEKIYFKETMHQYKKKWNLGNI